jgi:hypothetical protein
VVQNCALQVSGNSFQSFAAFLFAASRSAPLSEAGSVFARVGELRTSIPDFIALGEIGPHCTILVQA